MSTEKVPNELEKQLPGADSDAQLSGSTIGMIGSVSVFAHVPAELDRWVAGANRQSTGARGVAPSIEQLFAEQQRWSYETFGPPEHRGPAGTLKHLCKEAKEAAEEQDPAKKLVELADILLLAIDAVHRSGASYESWLMAAFEKMRVNRDRTWPDWRTMKAGEPVEHDRSKEPELKDLSWRRNPVCDGGKAPVFEYGDCILVAVPATNRKFSYAIIVARDGLFYEERGAALPPWLGDWNSVQYYIPLGGHRNSTTAVE